MKKRIIHSRVLAAVLALCLCFSIQVSATEADLKKQQKETQRQLGKKGDKSSVINKRIMLRFSGTPVNDKG